MSIVLTATFLIERRIRVNRYSVGAARSSDLSRFRDVLELDRRDSTFRLPRPSDPE
jgi:hypothetical protein